MSQARYRPRARLDLHEISEAIALDDLNAAIRFCLAVEDAAEKLARFPGMGAHRSSKNPQFTGLRSWPIKGFRKYLILYKPEEYGIEIVRIIHGARDIDSILAEED